jgi:hypothetical protein
MTLSDLAALGSFVSGFAVLVSLLYLAVELRRAERNQRAMIQQGRSARLVDMFLRFSEPDTTRIFFRVARGEPPATQDELAQFNAVFNAQNFSQEDTFLQHRMGLIGDAEFAGFRERLKSYYALPGVRARWAMTRTHYGPDFRAFIDGLVHETADAGPADLLAEWNAAVAAETRKKAAGGSAQPGG